MDDNIEYAKLLSSVNTGKTGLQRQLSPIEVAQYIERLVDEEGMDTTLMLLPLEKKLISDFRVLLTFPERVQNGIIWGQTKDGGLGFSAVVYIAPLKESENREMLCKAAAKKEFKVDEIKEIVRFYRENDIPLIDVIEKITNSRPVITKSYMVVISFLEDIQKKISEIAKKLNKSNDEVIIMKLKEKLELNGITTVVSKGKNILIDMDEEQYRQYKTQVKNKKLEFDKITEFLVS
jgi:hypothetical protein